ncbi:MAG: Bax inhibitor-1/YccA family protein [Alphaproteobacteria bacterium]|nr:Bax inhibitor-1/YccA family protein [Alphaproteobacteria bacterium]
MNMNELQRKPSVEIVGHSAANVDQGLRSYMIKVFNYMGAGLILTAAVAWLVANTGLITLFYNIDTQNSSVTMSGLGWLVAFAPLIMIFAFSYVANNKSLGAVQLMFWAFSAVMGASLASIFLLYTAASMTRVFLITAATFGAMSLYGYTTKRDLTKLGSFLFMGLIGLIIASIVNIFMQSPAIYWALSYIGVAIFVGLTAYDTQRMKDLYYSTRGSDEAAGKMAVSGALSLYLDFINLFMYLLRIMGDRR